MLLYVIANDVRLLEIFRAEHNHLQLNVSVGSKLFGLAMLAFGATLVLFEIRHFRG